MLACPVRNEHAAADALLLLTHMHTSLAVLSDRYLDKTARNRENTIRLIDSLNAFNNKYERGNDAAGGVLGGDNVRGSVPLPKARSPPVTRSQTAGK